MPVAPPRSPAARLRGSLAALLLVVVSLLAVPAAGHAAAWSTKAAFGTTLSSINIVSATSPDGSAFAAWLDIPGAEATNPSPPHTGGPLYVQHAGPDGTLNQRVQVDTVPTVGVQGGGGRTPSETRPALVAGPSGTAVLAWAYPATTSTWGLRLAFLTASGTVRRTVDLGTFTDAVAPSLGVAASGTVTLLYYDGTNMLAARVTPDGAPTTTTLGATLDAAGVLTVAPDGTAWAGWLDGSQFQVVRLDPSGAVSAGPTPFALLTNYPAITVAPDGSGAALVGVDVTSSKLVGARLTTSGGPIANTFSAPLAPGGAASSPMVPTVALSPDGTVTAAESLIGAGGTFVTGAARFAPDQTTSGLFDAFGSSSAILPALTAGPDGRVLAAWSGGSGASESPVQMRVIAADGSLGRVEQADTASPFSGFRAGTYAPFATGLSPSFSPTGQLRLGVTEILPKGTGGARLRVRDGDPPTATASVPASATVGTPVAMSVDAGDPSGIGGVKWDFGDGSSAAGASVSHTYGAPGTYTVTATVTDTGDNATTITRTLTITPVPPTVVVQPAPAPKPAAVLHPAKLVITKASRSGRKVTVTGTITKTASGKVTITYTQRVGGATITQRKTAKIVKGRFTVVLTVPSAVAKAKSAATARVTYAGDADTLKGTTKHVVSKAKAKKKRSGNKK